MKSLQRIYLYMFIITSFSHAGSLKFDTYLSEGKVTEGMSSYPFEFKFENEGESKVKITGLKSSCGCTVAKPDKEEYLPKEKGIIKGTFTIGDRVGIQDKQEWCTQTGMIMSDSGGEYKTGNEVFDKYYVEKRARIKNLYSGIKIEEVPTLRYCNFFLY